MLELHVNAKSLDYQPAELLRDKGLSYLGIIKLAQVPQLNRKCMMQYHLEAYLQMHALEHVHSLACVAKMPLPLLSPVRRTSTTPDSTRLTTCTPALEDESDPSTGRKRWHIGR